MRNIRVSHVAHMCGSMRRFSDLIYHASVIMSHVSYASMSYASRVWMSHFSHVGMSHVSHEWMSHVPHTWMKHFSDLIYHVSVIMSHVSNLSMSHVSHVGMSHILHVWTSHVPHTWVKHFSDLVYHVSVIMSHDSNLSMRYVPHVWKTHVSPMWMNHILPTLVTRFLYISLTNKDHDDYTMISHSDSCLTWVNISANNTPYFNKKDPSQQKQSRLGITATNQCKIAILLCKRALHLSNRATFWAKEPCRAACWIMLQCVAVCCSVRCSDLCKRVPSLCNWGSLTKRLSENLAHAHVYTPTNVANAHAHAHAHAHTNTHACAHTHSHIHINTRTGQGSIALIVFFVQWTQRVKGWVLRWKKGTQENKISCLVLS